VVRPKHMNFKKTFYHTVRWTNLWCI
jgi:hypothetical protein